LFLLAIQFFSQLPAPLVMVMIEQQSMFPATLIKSLESNVNN